MLGWLSRWRARQVKRELRKVLERIDQDNERVRAHLAMQDDILPMQIGGPIPPGSVVVRIGEPFNAKAATAAIIAAIRDEKR